MSCNYHTFRTECKSFRNFYLSTTYFYIFQSFQSNLSLEIFYDLFVAILNLFAIFLISKNRFFCLHLISFDRFFDDFFSSFDRLFDGLIDSFDRCIDCFDRSKSLFLFGIISRDTNECEGTEFEICHRSFMEFKRFLT